MRIKKSKKINNYIFIIFLVLILSFLFNNKKIGKEIIKTNKENNFKALEQEGQNYRLVTSADNVQVPVPKGYVASNVTGEIMCFQSIHILMKQKQKYMMEDL